MKKSIWETLTEREFDVSDAPQEPAPAKRRGPPSAVPVRRDPKLAARGRSFNPGMPPEHRKDEAPVGVQPASSDDMAHRRRRQSSPTIPMGIPTNNPASSPSGAWMVTNPKTGEKFRVEAGSPEEAKQLVVDMMADELAQQGIGRHQDTGPESNRGTNIDANRLSVQPAVESVEESTTGANGAGFQLPLGDAAEAARRVYFKEALQQVFKETVRKLPNGKFGVYLKNKGKKKAPKKVGEYPDRVAAREAELARGGKSGDSAKKERDRLNKLKKDPKKMAAAKKRDSKTKSKATKESFVRALTVGIKEALFREEDFPGSPWDERLAALSPNAMASDKKLASLTQAIQKASVASLMDAQKELARTLKKHGKCTPGEVGTETGGKTYIPIHIHRKGEEFGPIYLYVDRGQVRLEYSDEMQESLDGLDDDFGDRLRGMIMKFQEKQLPRFDGASKAIKARDQYLDKLDGKLDGQLSGFSGVELQMIKQLINQKHGRRFR